MIDKYSALLSTSEKIQNAFQQVFGKYHIPKEEQKEAKKLSYIKREVDEIMSQYVTGRIDVIRKRGGSSAMPTHIPREKSALQIYPVAFYSLYSNTWRKIKTDKDKLSYLDQKLDRNEIPVLVYIELKAVLDLKDDQNNATPKVSNYMEMLKNEMPTM